MERQYDGTQYSESHKSNNSSCNCEEKKGSHLFNFFLHIMQFLMGFTIMNISTKQASFGPKVFVILRFYCMRTTLKKNADCYL